MTDISPTALGLPSVRTIDWLAGTDLLKTPDGIPTDQLVGLGPIASAVETAIVGDTGPGQAGPLPAALAGPANQAVLDTHAQLEQVGHEVAPLNGPLHGLTNLGETLGLGHLNTPGNLVTDAASTVLSGDAAAAPALLADESHAVTAAGALAESATGIAAPGAGLVGSGGLLSPVTDALNQGVLTTHASLEEVGHQNPGLNGPIHGLTGLGEAVGLGHIGEPGNLVTDVTNLPGAILAGGGVGAAAPILHDLGDVTTALGTLVDQVAGSPAANGGLLSPSGLLAPVSGAANAAILDLHAGIETIGHEVPALNDAVHAVTGLGETVGLGHLGEPGNLVTDVANLPGGLLGGEGTGAIAPVVADAGAVLGSAGTLVGAATGAVTGILGSAAGGDGGPLQPVTGLVGEVTGALTGGNAGGDGAHGTGTVGDLPGQVVGAVTGAVGGLLGGGAGAGADPVGGLLGGVLGGVSPGGGASDGGGSHPLVSVAVGPESGSSVVDANLLSSGSGTTHPIEVNAIDVGSAVPALANVGLLGGDGIAFPSSGGGHDTLAGHAAEPAPAASPAPAEAAPAVHVDLGIAAIDLGGHVDAHAADTQHHAGSGLHLLGL